MIGSYTKYTSRFIFKNILRLIAIILISAIELTLISAISSLPPMLKDSIDKAGLGDVEQLKNIQDQIQIIIFPVSIFFFVVAGIVIFITMVQLINEEKTKFGTMKSLGYSNGKIIFPLILFCFIGCAIGSIIGQVLGDIVVSRVLYKAILDTFDALEQHNGFYYDYGIYASIVMILIIMIICIAICLHSTKKNTATLLMPPSPKPGHKILLEKIGFIWKRMPFKYKTTYRNIFRYTGKLIMTLLTIAGTSSITFVGCGLYACMSNTNGELLDTMMPITISIVFCAVLLSIVIIYNLTNINIEERKREIATLKVLGYSNFEVVGYIFREIFIVSFVGILIGLPLGYLFMWYLINALDFGDFNDVKWYVWFITGGFLLLTMAIVDLLLFRKIHKINMISSLKIID